MQICQKINLATFLALEHLIKVGSSFSKVVNHARTTERAYIKTYRGGGKGPCHQYSVSSISTISVTQFEFGHANIHAPSGTLKL